METKKIQVGNFNVCFVDDADGASYVGITTVGETGWTMRYDSHCSMYSVIAQYADGFERGEKNYKEAFEAQLCIVFAVCTLGPMDVEAVNDFCTSVGTYRERMSAALDKLSDKEKEEADAKEWMERQRVLEEMAGEGKK